MDNHVETATKVFGCREDEVTPEMRTRAKAINFGGCYGTRPSDLADMVELGEEDRARLMAEWEDYFVPLFGLNANECSWCHENTAPERLVDGRGPCEGQQICITCILKKEA